ncbi:MAG: mechanosensitive ion channel [Chloroflexi bacterium]|jgi:moderate conductance mechanosensitive channel|nr:mechanosensitive ion channel [Chloroflexota bacterium]MBT4074492.1 mechanosensitive ion channel [Chloroflexota bacterium]MBT6682569.1 mechanosensitive ion channel [Chloroflexota bacterium]
MRSLFGHPEDGSFLAWFADDGIWALLIAVSAVVLWLLLRHYLHKVLERGAMALDEVELDVVGSRGRAIVAFAAEGPILIALIGAPATIWIMAVLDKDVGPATEALVATLQRIGDSFAAHGLPVIVIIFLAYVGTRILQRFVPPMIRQFVKSDGTVVAGLDEAQARASTLASVLAGSVAVLIWAIALFSVLAEIGVPVGPLLAGFGIAGIAVGFGAQSLVKDFIAGFFIVGENQYRRGDVVEIASIAGLVEEISLRRTVLRDLQGRVHVVPNGEISVSTNFSKNWSRVLLDVGVAYRTDLDHAIRVLNEVGQEVFEDPDWSDQMTEAPQVLRVNSFDDSSITIRVLGVCRPLTQWGIMGELRRRIKRRFDEQGIEIPFPHQTVYWGEAPGNRANLSVTTDAAESLLAQTASQEQREAQFAELALAADSIRTEREEVAQGEPEDEVVGGPVGPGVAGVANPRGSVLDPNEAPRVFEEIEPRATEFVISHHKTGEPTTLTEALEDEAEDRHEENGQDEGESKVTDSIGRMSPMDDPKDGNSDHHRRLGDKE